MEPGSKLTESGSMILTAHSFLPSLAEIRLGWSLAIEEETEWMVATLTRLANRSMIVQASRIQKQNLRKIAQKVTKVTKVLRKRFVSSFVPICDRLPPRTACGSGSRPAVNVSESPRHTRPEGQLAVSFEF